MLRRAASQCTPPVPCEFTTVRTCVMPRAIVAQVVLGSAGFRLGMVTVLVALLTWYFVFWPLQAA